LRGCGRARRKQSFDGRLRIYGGTGKDPLPQGSIRGAHVPIKGKSGLIAPAPVLAARPAMRQPDCRLEMVGAESGKLCDPREHQRPQFFVIAECEYAVGPTRAG